MKEEKILKNHYCVYKHTTPNGRVYIGITGRNPIYRWNNGGGYAGQPKFYKAILKYGWDNIKHEIVYSGLTEEEAYEKEKELIQKYDSVQNGYNCSTGGENIHAGARKYNEGDIVGEFEIIGSTERKIVLRCLNCGAVLERYRGSVMRAGVKCKCMIKYNPNPKKQEHITFEGRTQSARKWAEELGIPAPTLWSRYKKGQPINESRQSPKTERACETCGKLFIPKRKTQKFCCQKCQTDSLKKSRPILVCECCGKEFQPTRSINDYYRAMFCSIDCRIEYQKAQARKESGNHEQAFRI